MVSLHDTTATETSLTQERKKITFLNPITAAPSKPKFFFSFFQFRKNKNKGNLNLYCCWCKAEHSILTPE